MQSKSLRPVRLVALVVTYNRLGKLERTIERLLESGNLYRILVVDNASTDGTGAWLYGQTDERIETLTLPENVGGAGGFEVGMRHAVGALLADWIVLMDDDAKPHPGMLSRFLDRPRDSHGAWVTAVYLPDGSVCEMNRPLVNPFASLGAFARSLLAGRDGYHIQDDGYAATDVQDVDGGSFVGLFVSSDAVERTGYPDGSLFIYGDDALYSLAMRRAGVRIAFDPALTFEHDCGSEMGAHPIRPLWKVYYMYRNQLMVYRRAAGPVLFWPVFLLKSIGWRLKARRYGDDRDAYIGLWKRALRDGVARRTSARFADVRAWADTGSAR